jgi:hypothetical protein
MIKICKECKQKFEWNKAHGNGIYCSRNCADKNRKNPIWLKGTVKHPNYSGRPKGTKDRCSNEKRVISHKGLIKSEETKMKIKKANSGANCYNWKGGITPENKRIRHSSEYRVWRTKVFVRDNFTCQICKEVGGELQVHHIHSFSKHPELRFDVTNGVTLCVKCHKKVEEGELK